VAQSARQWTFVKEFPTEWVALMEDLSAAHQALEYVNLYFSVLDNMYRNSLKCMNVDTIRYNLIRDAVFKQIAHRMPASAWTDFGRFVKSAGQDAISDMWWDSSKAAVGGLVWSQLESCRDVCDGLSSSSVSPINYCTDNLDAAITKGASAVSNLLEQAKQGVATLPRSHDKSTVSPNMSVMDEDVWRFFTYALYQRSNDKKSSYEVWTDWPVIETFEELRKRAKQLKSGALGVVQAISEAVANLKNNGFLIAPKKVAPMFVSLWQGTFLTNVGLKLKSSAALRHLAAWGGQAVQLDLLPFCSENQLAHPQKSYAAFRLIQDARDYCACRVDRRKPYQKDQLWGMADDPQVLAWHWSLNPASRWVRDWSKGLMGSWTRVGGEDDVDEGYISEDATEPIKFGLDTATLEAEYDNQYQPAYRPIQKKKKTESVVVDEDERTFEKKFFGF